MAETEEEKPWVDDGSLPLEEGRALRAHLLDAHEEIGRPGTVYLFCKVRLAPGHCMRASKSRIWISILCDNSAFEEEDADFLAPQPCFA